MNLYNINNIQLKIKNEYLKFKKLNIKNKGNI